MTGAQLKRKSATVIAEDFSTANIGGAMSSTELTGAIAETLFEMPSTAVGSGDGSRVQRGKEFLHNTSSDTLWSAAIYFANWLAEWGAGADTVGLTPTHEGDEGKTVRLIGYSVTSAPATFSVTLGDSGTQVFSGDLLTDLARVLVYDEEGNLSQLAGQLAIRRGNGTELGFIPAGYYSATAEMDAWLPPTANDTTTAATAASDPAGATWARPRGPGNALQVASSGTLGPGAAQGFWIRLTVKEGLPASTDVEYLPTIIGNDHGS